MSRKASSAAGECREQGSSAYSDLRQALDLLVWWQILMPHFSFSPCSFLGCDVKDLRKPQVRVSTANPVSAYTGNHSSLHWRSVSPATHFLGWCQELNTLSVINTLPLKYIYQISLNRKLGPLGKQTGSRKLSEVTRQDFVCLGFLPFDTWFLEHQQVLKIPCFLCLIVGKTIRGFHIPMQPKQFVALSSFNKSLLSTSSSSVLSPMEDIENIVFL